MKNQWRIVLGLTLTLIIVIFAILNNQEVEINFGFSQIQSPLIITIIGSAFIGALVIALVATSGYMKQRKTIADLKKQLVKDDDVFEQRLAEKREQLEREYANKEIELRQHLSQTSEEVSNAVSSEASKIDYFD